MLSQISNTASPNPALATKPEAPIARESQAKASSNTPDANRSGSAAAAFQRLDTVIGTNDQLDALKAKGDAIGAAAKSRFALAEAEFQLLKAESVQKNEERVSALEATEPEAATVLNSEQVDAVEKLLEGRKPNILSDDGTRAFIVDGQQYTFAPGGEVTVHTAGVPRSEEEKLSWLDEARRSLASAQNDAQGITIDEATDLVAQKRTEFESASLAAEKVNADFEARYGSSDSAGSLYDKTA